ncbi:MAG: hypothetical protein H6623_03055 [Bdellovibrionaceae bacterium]|nr:hypothetical protein [Pseudobdellovibrionaceae bacterium]
MFTNTHKKNVTASHGAVTSGRSQKTVSVKIFPLWIITALSSGILLSCASYQSKVSSVRDLMQQGQYNEAIEKLQKDVDESNGDQLAYLLEYATLLHEAGRYKESNEAFERADSMCDINDYTSVSRETGAMIVQEGMIQYKAETFEYLLINIYQALNYLLLNDYDNAQVKARKLNEKINKIELGKEAKKKQTSFAAYLAALLFEAQHDYDNAYILYNKAYDLDPSNEIYQRGVLVSSKLARREETFNRLKNRWPKEYQAIDWKHVRDNGEFVFLFQQGWIPRKHPQPGNRRLPELVSVPSRVNSVAISVSGKSYSSAVVYDLDTVSKQILADDIGRLLARAVARQATREVVRQSAYNNNKNAGLAAAALATFVFEAMDVADTRQWSTLPKTLQVVRVSLPPGEYDIAINAEPGNTALWSGKFTLSKGQRRIQTARAY